ncbi:MAG TPA: HAD family hydrolase [Candidatus Paceibacterota bacterium]|nr:HAD family hydrolase [Verrucomicrobiota bacterium]HRZ43924.1 HAD family hydrolase [Candidatus Paceibacterota bacterium]HRZ93513.1 HAD family hydrolase [Candidatus Paceibacterota bacterium]
MATGMIQVICTDFDGTLHAEGEQPPVPAALESLLADLQARGARWVINTGRTLPDLLVALDEARLRVSPDFLVVVEREIHVRQNESFVALADWNDRCQLDQEQLFARIRPRLPEVVAWIRRHFSALVYDDRYSPFCLMAGSDADTDAILDRLAAVFADEPDLMVVRNSVYARFSHRAYNKGSALGEIVRRLGCPARAVFAAGDHVNDLPMLSREYAHYLTAPANAVPEVQAAVRGLGGYVSPHSSGHGVRDALEFFLSNPDPGLGAGHRLAAER